MRGADGVIFRSTQFNPKPVHQVYHYYIINNECKYKCMDTEINKYVYY